MNHLDCLLAETRAHPGRRAPGTLLPRVLTGITRAKPAVKGWLSWTRPTRAICVIGAAAAGGVVAYGFGGTWGAIDLPAGISAARDAMDNVTSAATWTVGLIVRMGSSLPATWLYALGVLGLSAYAIMIGLSHALYRHCTNPNTQIT